LVNLITTAVLKISVPASNFAEDEEENSKYVLSLLKEGCDCILFDNVKHGTHIVSESLAKAMSSERFQGRLLGANENLAVGTAATWFFTGTNIVFSGDFSTRVYPIRLTPLMENPEERRFKRENLLDFILEQRPFILRALISIIIGGQETEPLKIGSRYKIWDKYIRMPLYAVSDIDINKAIDSNKEDDVDMTNRKKLVHAIFEEFGGMEVTSLGIIKRSFDENKLPINTVGELLDEISGKYAANTKSLGRLLGKMVARTWGGLILTREDTDKAYWLVKKVKSD